MANPFDDDVDVSSFYKPTNSAAKKTSVRSPVEDDVNFYERQIEEILQNTLESSNRGVMMLEESEQIGFETAKDLAAQGEKLQKIERNLDEINASTKQSQRHLNSIKSVFGGMFKNYFTKAPPPGQSTGSPPVVSVPSGQQNKLTSTVQKLSSADYGTSDGTAKGQRTLNDSTRATISGTRWGAMDDQVDENLDLMSSKLKSLRELGSALGTEIDQQNESLDKINVKAVKADEEIRHQDKQMKKILGNKPANKGGVPSSTTSDDQNPPSIFGKKK